MTTYIMYDILKPPVFWKIWWRGPPNFISGGGAQMALIRLWIPRLSMNTFWDF